MPLVHFSTTPNGATTFVNGVYRGITPFSDKVAAGEVELVFWKKGFQVAKYADIVGKDGGNVGTSLEQNEEVPGPPDMAPPLPAGSAGSAGSQTQRPALGGGDSGTASRWPTVLFLVAAGGAGAFWWYRRRGKRGKRQLKGPGYRKRTGNGSTPVAGLGASETSCSEVPGARVAVRTCITRPRRDAGKLPGPAVKDHGVVCHLLDAAKNSDRESFFTISVDPQLNVLGIEETHKGTAGEVQVHPREVFKSAMLLNASAVIVAHNHPSGNAEPSRDDESLTRRLVKAGKLVGIPVLDHIVIGVDGCRSIATSLPKLFEDDES